MMSICLNIFARAFFVCAFILANSVRRSATHGCVDVKGMSLSVGHASAQTMKNTLLLVLFRGLKRTMSAEFAACSVFAGIGQYMQSVITAIYSAVQPLDLVIYNFDSVKIPLVAHIVNRG